VTAENYRTLYAGVVENILGYSCVMTIPPEAIERAVREACREYADPILERMRPSIRLLPDRVGQATDVSAVRLGGTPAVTRGFEWPTVRGRPLTFLGQVHLGSVHAFDLEEFLPPSGSLCFFYDPVADINPTMALAWFDAPSDALAPARPPTPEAAGLREVILRPALEWTCPSAGNVMAEPPMDLFESIDELKERLRQVQGFEMDERRTTTHRLLGHPDFIQGVGVDDSTTLLVQIDSDPIMPPANYPSTGIKLGDQGRLYFFASRQVLRRQGFAPLTLGLGALEMS
jgi:uncharacterized protein YwqG